MTKFDVNSSHSYGRTFRHELNVAVIERQMAVRANGVKSSQDTTQIDTGFMIPDT